MRMSSLASVAIITMALSFSATAQTETPTTGKAAKDNAIQVGTLMCKLSSADNKIIYSNETFDCVFNPSTGPDESYAGKITSLGISLTIERGQALLWAVFAPSKENAKGSLAGKYAGASADVAVGAGVGAKVLVGGGGESFTLQPLSLAGTTGLGAAVGIQKFELKLNS